MSIAVVQKHTLILPTFWLTGLEVEDIDDLLEHTSREFYIADIHEKRVSVMAIENLTAGIPGNLWVWVELSPVNSVTSAAYWAAIGGGGGAIVPTAPLIIVGTGVNGTTHTEFVAWTVHSQFARVVVQTPVSAAIATAIWQVQIIIEGKTP